MNPKQPDREAFESYLQGESPLSRAYETTAEEAPPVELDARILERARQAVQRPARLARSPFTNTWMVPVALAAVLVLTVGLVTFMFEETDSPLRPETLPVPSSDSTLEEEVPVVRDKAGEVSDMLRLDQPADEKAAPKAKRSLVIESPAASSPAVDDLTETGRQLRKTDEKKKMVPAESEMAPAEAGDGLLRSRAQGGAATHVEAEAERPKEEDKSLESAGQPRVLRETSQASEIMAPEEWLAKITTLRAQGKHMEADASLAAFRKRYPDYPLDKLRE